MIGAVCCLAGTAAHAAGNSSGEVLVAAEVRKLYEVITAAKKVEVPQLQKVTDASIDDVKVTINHSDNSSTGSKSG